MMDKDVSIMPIADILYSRPQSVPLTFNPFSSSPLTFDPWS